jgi:hypothetical protein
MNSLGWAIEPPWPFNAPQFGSEFDGGQYLEPFGILPVRPSNGRDQATAYQDLLRYLASQSATQQLAPSGNSVGGRTIAGALNRQEATPASVSRDNGFSSPQLGAQEHPDIIDQLDAVIRALGYAPPEALTDDSGRPATSETMPDQVAQISRARKNYCTSMCTKLTLLRPPGVFLILLNGAWPTARAEASGRAFSRTSLSGVV